jgi:hypothetical protein
MMRKQLLVLVFAVVACSTSGGGLAVMPRDDGNFEIGYSGSFYRTNDLDARAAGHCGRQPAGFVRQEEREDGKTYRIYRCMER